MLHTDELDRPATGHTATFAALPDSQLAAFIESYAEMDRTGLDGIGKTLSLPERWTIRTELRRMQEEQLLRQSRR